MGTEQIDALKALLKFLRMMEAEGAEEKDIMNFLENMARAQGDSKT